MLKKLIGLSLLVALGVPVAQAQKADHTPVVADDTGINLNQRWTFDPLNSDQSKFIFNLKASDASELTFTCDRGNKYIQLTYKKDGVVYHAPDFDSVTAYTPSGVLRDSIIVNAGPTPDKLVQFFNDTTIYYVILKHQIYGKFIIAPKGAGDLGANIAVCRGLPFKS